MTIFLTPPRRITVKISVGLAIAGAVGVLCSPWLAVGGFFAAYGLLPAGVLNKGV